MNRASLAFSWICRSIAILLIGMTLYYKFSGAPLPVAIFTALGVEPWGRYLTAVIELIAILLLIYPKTVPIGAILTVLIMASAITIHIVVLGVSLQDVQESLPKTSKHLAPDPSLFAFAWITLLSALIVLTIHLDQLKGMVRRKPVKN